MAATEETNRAFGQIVKSLKERQHRCPSLWALGGIGSTNQLRARVEGHLRRMPLREEFENFFKGLKTTWGRRLSTGDLHANAVFF